MKEGQKLWNRDELIVAINLYCKTPFGKLHKSNPDVVELAGIIGRSPNAVAWKLGNLAAIDPTIRQKGADHGGNLEKEVWKEFFNNWDELAWRSEQILANFRGRSIEDTFEDNTIRAGIEKELTVRSRVNQSFFRKSVLSAYNSVCCITGISHPNLLIASHIIPWSKNEKHRVNPTNGLCLNSLHDKAFDSGLMTVTPDYKVKISDVLLKHKGEDAEYFTPFEKRPINLPQKFLPDRDFLDWHNQNVFVDSQ